MDAGGQIRGSVGDSGNGRGQQKRLVPQQWRVSARAGACDTSAREHATNGLAQPGEKRLTAAEAKQERRRVKELEREIRRKDKALAEAAALLVLSKKAEAIFSKYRAEDE